MRRAVDLATLALPWLAGGALMLALVLIFLVVPTERDQGIVQRIFYVHVPSAWTAFLGFLVVAAASAMHLWTGRESWDRAAIASAEIGIVFCSLVLLTGPIWARPIWGTWWTWDPRLTMTLILWTIYASYLILRSMGGADEPVARYAAVLGIVGVLDIPLIRVSVRLWRGIHPSVIANREGGSGLTDPSMRFTLYLTALVFVLLYVWMVRIRVRWLRVEDETESLARELQPA